MSDKIKQLDLIKSDYSIFYFNYDNATNIFNIKNNKYQRFDKITFRISKNLISDFKDQLNRFTNAKFIVLHNGKFKFINCHSIKCTTVTSYNKFSNVIHINALSIYLTEGLEIEENSGSYLLTLDSNDGEPYFLNYLK